MLNIFLVASGGATGAILRFCLTNLSKSLFTSSIYGTLSVNILGSFLIGYIITSPYVKSTSEDFINLFLIVGLLGSFTTFSTFSLETIEMINDKKIAQSLIYIFLSIIICLCGTMLGLNINKI